MNDFMIELELCTPVSPERTCVPPCADTSGSDALLFGHALSVSLIREAVLMEERYRREMTAELKRLTGLANPNSPVQLKRWLERQGVFTESLSRKSVAALLPAVSGKTAAVLRLRQQLNRIRKYRVTADCLMIRI